MPEFLFAYGTLQEGLAPREVAPLVARMRRVGEGTVAGTLYDLGHYPGAVLDAGSAGKIVGTVFETPSDAEWWRALDAYEEFEPELPEASQFIRVRCMVELAEGGTLECWMYMYNRSVRGAAVVESGAWKKRGGLRVD